MKQVLIVVGRKATFGERLAHRVVIEVGGGTCRVTEDKQNEVEVR